MASFTGIIYMTTNVINGKVYIGQSKSNNPYYIGGGSELKKAIVKYKKSNFIKVILVDNIESCEQLNCLERFYIKLYDSNNPLIGYNIRPGGENRSFNHTKEAINKIKERSNQQDNKERILQIQKLAAKSREGKHLERYSKEKMMTSRFGSLKKIFVYCKQTKTLLHVCTFSKDAETLTNVKRSAIRNNLCGLSKSAGDFIFDYKNNI
jgi:hypothetical protein